jgi:NAD-dependent deacetylase
MEERITGLYNLITGAKHCVALTGAGVSTLSGIRDFRGEKRSLQRNGCGKNL